MWNSRFSGETYADDPEAKKELQDDHCSQEQAKSVEIHMLVARQTSADKSGADHSRRCTP